MLFLTIFACGEPDAGSPSKPSAVRDPFVRIEPEELPPSFDSAFAKCEGSRWLVSADVAGRVDHTRAVVVRTGVGEGGGTPFALELALDRQSMPEGSLWERYSHDLPASAGTCDADHSTTVLEAIDAAGKVVDCVAFGHGAAAVVAGDHDDLLAAVTPGDWSGCRVR